MTLPNMESSEMPQEIESGEVQEMQKARKCRRRRNSWRQATFESKELVETGMDIEEAENAEAAFVEVMKSAVTELPEPVAEKGDDLGDGPMPPYDPRDGEPEKSSIGVPDAGGDVMIDTVPLPESPMEIGEREMIGTWPTPEEPSVMEQGVPSDIVDRAAIIDTNDGPRIINKMEAVDGGNHWLKRWAARHGPSWFSRHH